MAFYKEGGAYRDQKTHKKGPSLASTIISELLSESIHTNNVVNRRKCFLRQSTPHFVVTFKKIKKDERQHKNKCCSDIQHFLVQSQYVLLLVYIPVS